MRDATTSADFAGLSFKSLQGRLEAPPDPRPRDWKFHQEFNPGQTCFIYTRKEEP